MYPCAHCGQFIDNSPAQTSRGWMHAHCAAAAFPGIRPPSSKTSPAVVVLGIFGGILLLGIVSATLHGSPSSTSNTSTTRSGSTSSTTRSSRSGPAVTVGAAQLWTDYQNNEVAADEKYKGRLLLVTGTIASIDKDAFDNMVVRLQSPNQFMNVHAKLEDSEKSEAARLSKGQKVTVKCEGGGMIIGSPMLRDCTIE